MLKIAGTVFDMYDDPAFMADPRGQALLGSELKNPEDLSKMKDTDFAVKIASDGQTYRKYPTYNPTATAISCTYFLQKEAELPAELRKTAGRRLVEACKRHDMDVPSALQKYAGSAAAQVVKIAHEVDSRSRVTDTDTLYELTERQLLSEFPRMTPENRVIAAVEVEKVAGHKKIAQAIYDYLPKDTYGPLFKTAMKARLAVLRGDGADDFKLDTFTELAKSAAELHPAQFALRLKEFDKLAGFDQRYAAGLIDPYKACFGGNLQIEAPQAELAHPVQDGQALDKTASDSMSVTQHVAILRAEFPEHTNGFVKEASKTLDPIFIGSTYERARKLYFSR